MAIVTLVLSSISGFAQNVVAKKVNTSITEDGVTISFALENCVSEKNGTAKEYVILKILNKNAYPVQLSFKKNVWFDGKCRSCNSSSSEHITSVEIKANSTLNGSCNTYNGLRIFSKMLHLDKVRQLTNYELVDIKVDEIK